MAKKPTPPKPGRALKKGEVPRTPDAAAAATSGSDPVKVWQQRLIGASKDFDTWAQEYEVERCRKYYNGKHWSGHPEEAAKKKYTVNMVFATVETQLPSLLFSRPKVTVEPRPARAMEPGSDVSGRATLLESTLQTYVDNREIHFTFETTLALRDAYSHFGLVEVGYTADWIDNPNAEKPLLKENSDEPMLDEHDEPVLQPKRVLKRGSEALYLKRVPPQAFRVGPGRNGLTSNDWVAYYEWHFVEDVKKNPDYDVETLRDLQATGMVTGTEEQESNDTERQQRAGQVKLWKIWDLRKKVRHVLAEGQTRLLQQDRPFTYLPLAPLKFYEIADSWFPLPPIYNWLSPQDEINETREDMRTHRRRFKRRYMRMPGISPKEFEKLETGEDGVSIEVPKTDMIVPIPDADLSSANTVQELTVSRDDFNRVAGVSGEAQGVPQSPTATQANIVNVREQIRESRARNLVAEWLGDIVRLMMLTIKDKMQGGMMVKMNTDPYARKPPVPPQQPGVAPDPVGAKISSQLARTVEEWREIKAEDLGELDFDVKIDVASLSPVAEDAQRASWNVVLQLLTNQALLMLLMEPNPEDPGEPSPMLRKTLALNGIKSDQEVREIYRVGQAVVAKMAMLAMATAAAKGGPPPSGLADIGGGGGGAASPAIPAGPTTGTPAPGLLGG